MSMNISIVPIEKRKTKSLNTDDKITNKFADTHKNRRIILK